MENRTAPKKNRSFMRLLLCVAALLMLISGCDAVMQTLDKTPDFSWQAEAIVLSLNEYRVQKSAERMRALKAMDEITWYTDSGELKLSEIDKRMDREMEELDADAPGSALTAFCNITGLNVWTYLPPAENDPTLEEALKLRVNDLTGRTHSVAIPGARVIINALYEENFLIGDAYSADNFAPMVTLQARAIVEEISREENRTGTLSGKLDYQAEGGYFKVLCEALGIADDRLYARLQQRAGQMLAQNEEAQAAQQALEEEITAELPGAYTTVNGGELHIDADGSFGLMYGMSFSIGSWSFEDGVLMLGGEPAWLDADGLHVMEIDVPFYKTDMDAEEGLLTDEENEIYSILMQHRYYEYTLMDVSGWYGTTTDEERVTMAQELLDMFWELDEVHAIENANDFASLINDSYDYADRSLSVWEAACAISGVDPAPYDAVFEKVNS
ncbi:MAG TPA: hypothetical protein VN366_08260 [Feifaniaceae bacterium]|nr:hypothetical protein [Feifaniaceae bacterium]